MGWSILNEISAAKVQYQLTLIIIIARESPSLSSPVRMNVVRNEKEKNIPRDLFFSDDDNERGEDLSSLTKQL